MERKQCWRHLVVGQATQTGTDSKALPQQLMHAPSLPTWGGAWQPDAAGSSRDSSSRRACRLTHSSSRAAPSAVASVAAVSSRGRFCRDPGGARQGKEGQGQGGNNMCYRTCSSSHVPAEEPAVGRHSVSQTADRQPAYFHLLGDAGSQHCHFLHGCLAGAPTGQARRQLQAVAVVPGAQQKDP